MIKIERKVCKISVAIILIIILQVIFNTAYAETEHFEKGDLIYRKGFPSAGHTAIYCKWKEKTDPEKRISHRIIEAAGTGKTVWETTFAWFCNENTYLGGGSLYPTAEQRQRIVDLAYNRRGYEYHFFGGYKDRATGKKFYRTYRCDGLVEHCYEIALGNYGIVEDTNWSELTPKKQWETMKPLRIEPPTIKKIDIEPSELIDGKYHINDSVKIECKEVSDGPRGSGVAQVEFWLGPTDRPLDESQDKKIGTDNHSVPIKGDYKYLWDTTTVESGEYKLYAKAFDQAGNTKETYINVKIEEPPYYFHVQLSPEYVETGSPVSQTQTFTIKVQCYNYGTSVNPPPEGMVNKLSGTESYVKNASGEWEKEKINPDCQPPEAGWTKTDYNGKVSLGIANITNNAYELYAGGEKLEKITLADGTCSISGVVIKAKDGDISNDHLFLIISASDGAGSGNGALMVNPILVSIGEVVTLMKSAGSCGSTPEEAWNSALDWWNTWARWERATAGQTGPYFRNLLIREEPEPSIYFYMAIIDAIKSQFTKNLTAYNPDDYLSAHLVVKPIRRHEYYYNEQGWIEGKYNKLEDVKAELGTVWTSAEYYASSYTPSKPPNPTGENIHMEKGWKGDFCIALIPKMPE
ncbi:hypothetical protein KA005_15050 [bacterium]|nr:hypothetical protein [bacterium]